MKQTTDNKTLIFEGAGTNLHDGDELLSDLENYRIRTAFRNKKGVSYYLEISSGWIYDKRKKTKRVKTWLNVNHFFRADIEKDADSNYTKSVATILKELKLFENKVEYTKENVLKLLNENFDCEFEDIKIVGWSDYNVHTGLGGKNKYNIMNDNALLIK